MRNFLTKTTLWAFVSLLPGASLFAGDEQSCPVHCTDPCKSDPCKQVCPEPMGPPSLAVYNAPTKVETCCSFDTFASASFLYWQPIEENLELAVKNAPSGTYRSVVPMDFSYKPGFKIDLGFCFDENCWSLWAEYTQFHSHHYKAASVSAPPTDTNSLSPVTLAPFFVENFAYSSMNQTWRVNLDALDLVMGPTYYVGEKLLFEPYFGARVAWIYQKLQNSFSDGISTDGLDTPSPEANALQTSHSWAIGPRAGLDTNWLLGMGFSLLGNTACDILYTRYTRLQNSSSIDPATSPLQVEQKDLGYLRAHLECEMGFSWAGYSNFDKWHFDIAATYGFQAFFDQNMFRQYCSSDATGVGFAPNGNLYVHGLNITARFDF